MTEEALVSVRVAHENRCWHRAWVTSVGDTGLVSVVTWGGMPCCLGIVVRTASGSGGKRNWLEG